MRRSDSPASALVLALASWGASGACAPGSERSEPAQQEPGARSADAADPAGWYDAPGGSRILITHGPTGGLRVLDFETPSFGALPASPEADSTYVWRVDGVDRSVEFEVDAGGAIAGMRWSAEGGATGFLPRATRYPLDVKDVSFPSHSIMLAGSLLLPRGPAGRARPAGTTAVPGAVLIHGSADSDRDNVWAYTIAQAVARHDVAVLIPDKRGSGASGGDWRKADFEALARDALAGLDVLRAEPGVDDRCLGLLGLSQGGWIAPLAATMDDRVAFVVDVSGAAVSPLEQLAHEITQDLRASGFGEEDIERGLAHFGLADAFAAVPSVATWAAYEAGRHALLSDTLAPLAEALPADTAAWWWAWWRGVRAYDPVPRWASSEAPALVVYGAEDETDNVPVAESVRRLGGLTSADLEVRVYEGSGHALADSSGWIRRDVLDETAAWVVDACGA